MTEKHSLVLDEMERRELRSPRRPVIRPARGTTVYGYRVDRNLTQKIDATGAPPTSRMTRLTAVRQEIPFFSGPATSIATIARLTVAVLSFSSPSWATTISVSASGGGLGCSQASPTLTSLGCDDGGGVGDAVANASALGNSSNVATLVEESVWLPKGRASFDGL